MLIVKKFDKKAKIPQCAHPGEDLGFDLFALNATALEPNKVTKVDTGIAARFIDEKYNYGLIIKDRSSMAAKGIIVSAGVIDSGFSNRIQVLLTNHTNSIYVINTGEKIAQMIPILVNTEEDIMIVDELPESNRNLKGFGSTGK